MQVLVGTSGWMYKDWAKLFYPLSLKNEFKLTYFAEHFKTVEINSTFYRLPSESAVKNWYGSVPADFIFSVKLSRYLSHLLKLEAGKPFSEGLNNYMSRIHWLEAKLGPILVQLPASFEAAPEKVINIDEETKDLAKRYKLQIRLAFEFRHASWFTDEIMTLLKERNLAAVIASGPGRWPETRQITADFAFIRFHGDERLYASSYKDSELRKWAEFIKTDCKSCKAVYCYFNNDQSAKAVDNAKYLISQLKS